MNASCVRRTVLAVLVCGLAASAALVNVGNAGSAGPTAVRGKVAGTVETRVAIKRFAAVGTKIVGYGTATSTLRDAAGVTTSVAQKPFRISLLQRQTRAQQSAPCQILFLELDELDLTLLGVHVWLRAANHDQGEKIQLKLQAVRENGVLGKLFCDLAGTSTAAAKKASARKAAAVGAAKLLTRRATKGTIVQAKETLYAPNTGGSGMASADPLQTNDECQVIHLILGPLHLDLLGLIVDLNKIALDLTAIPGTTLGDLFCSLAGGPGTAIRTRS